jgi:hypothetical protein
MLGARTQRARTRFVLVLPFLPLLLSVTLYVVIYFSTLLLALRRLSTAFLSVLSLKKDLFSSQGDDVVFGSSLASSYSSRLKLL